MEEKDDNQWTNYLKRAVATVESSLDKVLDSESDQPQTRSAPNAAKTTTDATKKEKQSSPEMVAESKESTPAVSVANSPGPSTPRLSMQERLALAVKKRDGTGSPVQRSSGSGNVSNRASTSSARPSMDEEPALQSQPALDSTSQPSTQAVSQSEVQTEVKSNIEQENSAKNEVPTVSSDTKDAANTSVTAPDAGVTATGTQPAAEELPKQHDRPPTLKTLPFVDFEIYDEIIENLRSTAISNNVPHDSILQLTGKLDAQRTLVEQWMGQMQDRLHILAKDVANTQTSAKNKDKDKEQIALLMEEGQSMAKRELRQNMAIKKLRARDQDLTNQVQSLNAKLVKSDTEIAQLREKEKKLKSLSKVEQDFSALKAAHEKLEQEYASLHKNYDDKASEKIETANREISGLKGEVSQLRVTEKALLDDLKLAEAKTEHFRSMYEGLAATSHFGDDGAGVATGSENENEKGSRSALHLTRRIEQMQSQHLTATENWHASEASLLSKNAALESQVSEQQIQIESLRRRCKVTAADLQQAKDESHKLQSRISELDATVNSLNAKIEELNVNNSAVQTQLERKASELEEARESSSQRVAALTQDLEAAQSKLKELEFAFKEPEAPLPIGDFHPGDLDLPPSIHSSRGTSCQSSRAVSSADLYADGIVELINDQRRPSSISISGALSDGEAPSTMHASEKEFGGVGPGEHVDQSITASQSHGGSTNMPSMQLLGQMNTSLRRLELDLANCKQELAKMTKQKDAAYTEVSDLLKQITELELIKDRFDDMEKENALCREQQQAALVMLGEKSERVQELEADVDDLKTMYRQQIEDLVDQLQRRK